jgi:maleylpyruvate isomerase
VIADISYDAHGLARLAEWARTGIETPIHPCAGVREAEATLAAALPSRALRSLWQRSDVHPERGMAGAICPTRRGTRLCA